EIAKFPLILIPRGVPADGAAVVDDLVIVHPDLEQSSRVQSMAEFEDESCPLVEGDRDFRIFVANLPATRVRVRPEDLERAAAGGGTVGGERERWAVTQIAVTGMQLSAE